MSSDDESTPNTPPSEDDAKSTTNKLPESDVNFAFGPKTWYWIRCGTRWRSVRSSASDWDKLGVVTPYWSAFKHTTGIFLGGEDEDGDGTHTHSWNDSYMVKAEDVDSFVKTRDAYIRLHDWIDERVQSDAEKVKQVSICIGPKGSYFGRFGDSHIAYSLPKDLQKAIKESNSPPVVVALGIKGSWIVLFEDGSRTWDLRNAYPDLGGDDKLSNNSNRPMFAALNPYKENCYFVAAENGACWYKHEFDHEESGQIHEITDSYMRFRARRDGSTFSHTMTLGGVKRDVKITPGSNAHEGRGEILMATLRTKRNLIRHKELAFVGAVAGGAGTLAKITGVPTVKAVGFAASVGFGAALSTWFSSM